MNSEAKLIIQLVLNDFYMNRALVLNPGTARFILMAAREAKIDTRGLEWVIERFPPPSEPSPPAASEPAKTLTECPS